MGNGKKAQGERQGMGRADLFTKFLLAATICCLLALSLIPLTACFDRATSPTSASYDPAAESPNTGTDDFISVQNLPPTTNGAQVTVREVTDIVTPLAGSGATHWSLINLIAAVAAVIVLLIFAIRLFFDRSREAGYREEPIDAGFLAAMSSEQRVQYEQQRIDNYHVWSTTQQKHVGRRKVIYVNFAVLLIAILCVIEAIVMLSLTQDFAARMVIVDNLSPLFILILFVQLLAAVAAARIHNKKVEKCHRDLQSAQSKLL